jgi:hypothetical protein
MKCFKMRHAEQSGAEQSRAEPEVMFDVLQQEMWKTKQVSQAKMHKNPAMLLVGKTNGKS